MCKLPGRGVRGYVGSAGSLVDRSNNIETNVIFVRGVSMGETRMTSSKGSAAITWVRI